MSLGGKRPQMSRQLELPLAGRGEAPRGKRSEEEPTATHGDERSGASDLMERVVSRPNLQAALKRVRKNKGSPGIDGMTVEELPEYLRDSLAGAARADARGGLPAFAGKGAADSKERRRDAKAWHPHRARSVHPAGHFAGPAADDSTRDFSEHSHGFRPGRRAHDAVREAQRYIQAGRKWVVDVDLEQFFDRVNHDVLMGKLAKRIADRRVLRLIRRYLEAGIMASGSWWSGTKGRRKADRCRRCWRTCCSTKWTRSWRNADTPSSATPMTATCTCSRGVPASAS